MRENFRARDFSVIKIKILENSIGFSDLFLELLNLICHVENVMKTRDDVNFCSINPIKKFTDVQQKKIPRIEK